MKSIKCLLVVGLTVLTGLAYGQNFTSSANGSWTTGTNWGGGTSPSTTNEGWGTVNVNHNMTITGNYNVPNSTVNVSAGKTLTITGNLSLAVGAGGGNTIHVYGTLQVNGAATISANLRIYPGGKVIVDGNMTVINAQYITVGTSVAPPNYADLVVKQNLVSQSSGDITVNQNGRMAVYGNLTNNTSGGSLLNINSGGQVYIHGNINLTAGGNTITNSNSTNPYGLYVNGTISNPSSTTTANKGSKATMQSTNPGFASWVAAQPNSPLPVTLLFFHTEEISTQGISLVWATASELNFDYFDVERSSNAIDFVSIGKVTGQGTSNVRNDYSIIDEKPLIGKNYYRLKSVDFDSYTEYFKILAVDFSGEKNFLISPNPSDGASFGISLNFTPAVNSTVIVYDNLSNIIGVYTPSDYSQNISFTNTLKGGTYYAKIISDEFVRVERFVVR